MADDHGLEDLSNQTTHDGALRWFWWCRCGAVGGGGTTRTREQAEQSHRRHQETSS